MQFGNWQVTDTNIEWKGGGAISFGIPFQDMNAIRTDVTDNSVFYDWILRATDEDWLTQNDLFDLNYAFVYAIATSGQEFDYEIFDATLEEQFDRFDIEDNEDFEL
jgi:hypothetical protein